MAMVLGDSLPISGEEFKSFVNKSDFSSGMHSHIKERGDHAESPYELDGFSNDKASSPNHQVISELHTENGITEAFRNPPESGAVQAPKQEEKLPFKRKRRNMFDVKPEDVDGEAPTPLIIDQPRDNESGELVIGPGAGGLQPRAAEAKKALPSLSKEQEELVARAKRFAMEQSVQHVLAKQKVVQVAEMTTLQSTAQRQRALALMCRVYIGSINFNLNEEALRSAFIPFGPIKSIDLSRDGVTMQHKGFAFIEFDLPEAAQLALEQMNNVLLGGRNIKVGRPSNVPQAAPWIEQILEEARQYARIYVSSIHADLAEHDISSVFEAFGKVLVCQLAPDQMTGKHKGYGFIEYQTQQSANDAIIAMNLFDLGGQYLRVGRAITPPANAASVQGPPPAAALIAATAISANIKAQDTVSQLGVAAINSMNNPLINPLLAVQNPSNLLASNLLMASPAMLTGSVLTPSATMNPLLAAAATANVLQVPKLQAASLAQPTSAMTTFSLPPTPQATAAFPAQLKSRQQLKADLLEQKGIKEQNLEREENFEISGKDARYMMMQMLARSSGSCVVALKNMVDAEEVDEELETEVTEECSRFGEVVRVIIYQEKQGEEEDAEVVVKIFVEFSQASEAESAQKALNGRWFGGRAIFAAVYDQEKYNEQDFSG